MLFMLFIRKFLTQLKYLLPLLIHKTILEILLFHMDKMIFR